MASRVLCDYEALATIRFRHLGCHFLKQGALKTSLSARYYTLLNVRDC